MIGSSRTNNSPRETARAPYAAPQAVANTRHHDDAGVAQPLVPFVPPEFRREVRPDVMTMPGVQQLHVAPTFEHPNAADTSWAPDSVAQHFGSITHDEAPHVIPQARDAAADGNAVADRDIDVPDIDVSTNESSTELPWIDAFAADETEAEETWPMGEAGKRLDELTESLSSLDASRARQERTDAAAEEGVGSTDASLPMWNEDEWIDIMPTAIAASMPINSEIVDAVYDRPADSEAGTNASAESARVPAGPELTARALEALAQRIRVGEVQVPEAQPHMAEEALLAGVLASMLGWRQ